MKTRIIFLIGAAFVASFTTNAQPYWVVETNPSMAKETIVKIYDAQNTIVHEEILKGKILDVRQKSDRKFLDRKMKDVLQQKAIASTRRTGKSKKG